MNRQASLIGALARRLDRARRIAEIPIVLCIDVEPDPRTFDPADPPAWVGFERMIRGLPGYRQRLSEATGAPAAFTWFLRMDPQIAECYGSPAAAADAYREDLAELSASGDELGLHTHVYRWERGSGEWIVDYADPAWAEHCVDLGLDAFRAAFGRGCAVHRGGDAFLSAAMLSRLDARGVNVDLTVEPGLDPRAPEGERTRGLAPGFRGAPTRPYRSSPERFPAPDPDWAGSPLLVPLLSAPARLPPFRRRPLHAGTLTTRFVQRLAVELLREPPVIAALATRSSSALGERWRMVDENLEHLARHDGVRFVTASAAVERLGGGELGPPPPIP